MKVKFFSLFYALTLFLFSVNPLSANEKALFEKPRICALLPDLLSPLAIEPAIPNDFVAKSPSGDPSIMNALFWGNPSVLEDFFKNPKELKEEIINIQVSQNIQQKGLVLEGDKKLIQEMRQKGFQILNSKRLMMGVYPVWMVHLKGPHQETVLIAWIGLNASQGTVLMFSPVLPQGKKESSLFETFLTKTKPLDQEAFFRAHGLCLKEGETLVEEGGAQFKMSVEKRNRDHKLLIVVEPLNEETEFSIGQVKIEKMGGSWKKNQLVAEVEGEIFFSQEGKKCRLEGHKTSVLIRNVDKFTPNVTELKKSPKNKIYFQ
jgi:hypothetical protein